MSEWGARKVKALSKGMAQKVQILATIAHAPDLLLLDEPFSGLDPINQQAVEKMIRAAAGKGIKIGDVIVEAAQDAVKSPEDVAKSVEKVKKAGRKAVLLRVEDAKGDLRFVAVPLS